MGFDPTTPGLQRTPKGRSLRLGRSSLSLLDTRGRATCAARLAIHPDLLKTKFPKMSAIFSQRFSETR